MCILVVHFSIGKYCAHALVEIHQSVERVGPQRAQHLSHRNSAVSPICEPFSGEVSRLEEASCEYEGDAPPCGPQQHWRAHAQLCCKIRTSSVIIAAGFVLYRSEDSFGTNIIIYLRESLHRGSAADFTDGKKMISRSMENSSTGQPVSSTRRVTIEGWYRESSSLHVISLLSDFALRHFAEKKSGRRSSSTGKSSLACRRLPSASRSASQLHSCQNYSNDEYVQLLQLNLY